MSNLSDLLSLTTKQFFKIYIASVLIGIISYSIISFINIEYQKSEINSFLENIVKNNSSHPIEEGKNIEMLKVFSNIFAINISEKEKADFCAPFNCYTVSYINMYLNVIKNISFFLLFSLFAFLIFKKVEHQRNKALLKELNALNHLLEGNLQHDKNKTFKYKEINNLVKIIKEREKNLNFILNAKSIAHDIKSPLAALEVIAEDLESLPAESKEIAIIATNRIQEIASRLSQNTQKVRLSNYHLSNVINDIIKEKITEYKNNNDLNILLNDKTNGEDLVRINELEFSRVISNLINNSVESLSNHGEITVSLKSINNFALISIHDNGKGFSQKILDNPFVEGHTTKEHGQGMGLFSANKALEKFGAKIELKNESGALIEISIPLSLPAKTS